MTKEHVAAKWTPPSPGKGIPCTVEVPEIFHKKAEYALRMLLFPLGLEPEWMSPGELPDAGIYYGMRSPATDAVVLTYDYDAPAFFAGDDGYDASQTHWFEDNGHRWPMLFSHDGAPDLVASTFFWLSGRQEQDIRERDIHGRFLYKHSMQQMLDLRLRPVVEIYRERLKQQLQSHGIEVKLRLWSGSGWAFCSTHDIDYLTKWRRGILYREGVQYFLQNQRQETFEQRFERLKASMADTIRPGDPCRYALTRIREEVHARDGSATFFMKTGATGHHDVAYPIKHRFLRREIAALRQQGSEVALHPSYHAHTHEGYLRRERDRLTAASGETPASVRQHYYRYEAPHTSRLHDTLGFRIDSTLGFADVSGFRNATCMPFQVYDLEADEPLDLWEMPPAFMEGALFNKHEYSLEEAVAETRAIIETCRRFGGACVGLWHNVLWDEVDYPDWGEHFTQTLDIAVEEGGRLASLRDALEEWR